jgi:peptidoglycan/LPS O-acetylase OafA/YrhL
MGKLGERNDTWRLGRRPALDGLRGIAVALVVLSHAEIPGFAAGGVVGVTMFFTISGFLITSLLLEERKRKRRIDLKGFYARRAYRLLPAVVALIVVMFAASFILGPEVLEPWQALTALFYVANWFRASGDWLGSVSHTWSLSIEEQFYILWPLALILAGRNWRVLGFVAGVGAAVAVALRVMLWDDGAGLDRVYFGTDTRADAILLGCALAVWMHRRQVGTSRPWVATALTVLAVGCSVIGGAFSYIWTPLLVSLLTAGIIWLVTTGAYSGWLQNRVLALVGQRSYGLYLWHVPVMTLLLHSPKLEPVPMVARIPLLIGLSWLLTMLSWRFVESPFLRMKERRSERARTARPLNVH